MNVYVHPGSGFVWVGEGEEMHCFNHQASEYKLCTPSHNIGAEDFVCTLAELYEALASIKRARGT